MPFVPGGQGYIASVLMPNLIPASNIFSAAFIEIPPALMNQANPLGQYIVKYGGVVGIALQLAARMISKQDNEHPVIYPEGRVYGNREVYGMPLQNQPDTTTLEFIETRNPSVRDFFLKWATTIFDYQTSRSYNYQIPQLQATIYLYDFSPDLSAVVFKQTLLGAYPLSVNDNEAIGFQVDAQDLARITVQFKHVFTYPELSPSFDNCALLLREMLMPNIRKIECGV